MQKNIIPYSETFRIRFAEVNQHNQIKLSSLFQFMQEVAATHAKQYEFGFDDLAKKHAFWVLSRVRIDLDTFPKSNDDFTVTTWPKGTDKLFALRDFEFRIEDNIVGKATTSWLVMDMTNRRPLRPDILSDVNYPDQPSAIESLAPKLTCSEHMEFSHQTTSRFNDIDINQHVNNTRYIDWLTDSLSKEENHFKKTQVLVNFNSELTYNQTIDIFKARNETSFILEGRSGSKSIITMHIGMSQ